MPEQIPHNSPADPTTTLLEAIDENADTIKIPVPVVYPLANMQPTYRLEIGAEPDVEYMQVDDISGIAGGELGVVREVEDADEHPRQAWPAGTPIRLMLTHGALEQILQEYSEKFVHNDPTGIDWPFEDIFGEKRFNGPVTLSSGVGYSPTEYTFSTPGETAGVTIDGQPLVILTNPYAPLAQIILTVATPGRDAVLVNRSTSAGSVMVTGDFFGGVTTQPASVIVAPGESVRVSAMADGTTLILHTPAGLAQKQPLDAQLTQLAALNPANDDFIQQKAGVLANRTLQQVRADLLAPIAVKPVRLATATALAASSYNNAAGTITATANGSLTIDGVTPANGQAVLVKNQSSQLQNGVYTVTSNGGASAQWQLTRDPLFDSTAEMGSALLVSVSEGTSNLDTVWMLTTNVGFTLGSSALAFAQVAGVQAMHANRNPATSSQMTIGHALVEKFEQKGISSAMATNDLIVLLQPGSNYILQRLDQVTHGRRVKIIGLSPGVSAVDKITVGYLDIAGDGDYMRGADWEDGGGGFEAYLTTDESYMEFVADTINGAGARAWRLMNRSQERGPIRDNSGAGPGVTEISLTSPLLPVYFQHIDLGELRDNDEKWTKLGMRFAAGTRDIILRIDGVDIITIAGNSDVGIAELEVRLAKLSDSWLDLRAELRVDGQPPQLFGQDVNVDLVLGGVGGVDYNVWHSSSADGDTFMRRYQTGVTRAT